MLTPENGIFSLDTLVNVLSEIVRKEEILEKAPTIKTSEPVLSIREAVFSASEVIDASKSEGRILSQQNIACPPAVPIVVCGERISKEAIDAFNYYGIEKISVIK